jgi:exosortase A-associated hydrolase 1
MSSQGEIAFAFNCQGEELVGFLHKGNEGCDVGVLTLVAGGPQYRGGVGRQLVNFGRRLASEGIPVMRFDHRGMGDSEGAFRRFKSMQNDIAAAIHQFKRRAPGVRRVILWGGCDAATSALINAHSFPDVIGVVAVNPFVSSSVTFAKAARKHYTSRLLQASFWKKVAGMEYNVGEYMAAAARKLRNKINKGRDGGSGRQTGAVGSGFVNDLLEGIQNFDGDVLFLMGERFVLSDEFDVLIDSSPEWRAAYGKSTHERIEIEDGDQVFSTTAAQECMFDAVSEWIHRTYSGQGTWKSSSSERQRVPPVDAQARA